MQACEVCWTCKGLTIGTEIKQTNFENHTLICNGSLNDANLSMFKYFVCDKDDYHAMKRLKNSINLYDDINVFISKISDGLLPSDIIDAFIALRSSEKPVSRNIAVSSRVNKVKSLSHRELSQFYQHDKSKVFEELNYSVFLGEPNTQLRAEEEQDTTTAGHDTLYEPHELKGMTEDIRQSSNLFKSDVYLMKTEETKLKTECNISTLDNFVFFTCKLCSHHTKSQKIMLRHLNTHNDGKEFKCPHCKFTTLWRTRWNQHSKHCTLELLCHICGVMAFSGHDKLKKHVMTEHTDAESLQCNECGCICQSLSCLQDHKKKHKAKLFTCTLDGCDFKSLYQRSLSKHLSRKHSDEKSSLCFICGFQTKHRASLAKHMLIHQSLKKYKCIACSFIAFTAAEVTVHVRRKHLKQKIYSCPKCPFKTSYHFAIRKHVQRHEGIVEFSCSVCGESLPNMKKAKEHMIVGHGCTDYNIINDSKQMIKAKDYQIKDWKDNVLEEPTRYVVMMSEEEARRRNRIVAFPNNVIDVQVCSADVLEFATDILKTEVPSNSSMLSSPLHAATSSTHPTADIYDGDPQASSKERNPMLSATSNDLVDDENSLNSLFDLMTDFPRPPNPNRCQSASTLMFTSFSPHLVDRPLTPDFFSDSPSAGSFFPNFSTKSLVDADGIGTLSTFDSQQVFTNNSVHSSLTVPHAMSKVGTPQSPVLPNFVSSPMTGTGNYLGAAVNMTTALMRELPPSVDSILSETVLGGHHSSHGVGTLERNSAFTSITDDDFATDLQAAVASITGDQDIEGSDVNVANTTEESPFPVNITI